MTSERRRRGLLAVAVVILGLGLAEFGAVFAGAHGLATGLGYALVAVSVCLLVELWIHSRGTFGPRGPT